MSVGSMLNRSGVLGVVLVAAGGLAASGSGASATVASDDSGRIVFSRPFDGATTELPAGWVASQQFTANPDGSDEQLVNIPEAGEEFGRAVWSPDGQWLLFSNIPLLGDGEGSGFGPLPLVLTARSSRCSSCPSSPPT
jgi:hypothetical protein